MAIHELLDFPCIACRKALEQHEASHLLPWRPQKDPIDAVQQRVHGLQSDLEQNDPEGYDMYVSLFGPDLSTRDSLLEQGLRSLSDHMCEEFAAGVLEDNGLIRLAEAYHQEQALRSIKKRKEYSGPPALFDLSKWIVGYWHRPVRGTKSGHLIWRVESPLRSKLLRVVAKGRLISTVSIETAPREGQPSSDWVEYRSLDAEERDPFLLGEAGSIGEDSASYVNEEDQDDQLWTLDVDSADEDSDPSDFAQGADEHDGFFVGQITEHLSSYLNSLLPNWGFLVDVQGLARAISTTTGETDWRTRIPQVAVAAVLTTEQAWSLLCVFCKRVLREACLRQSGAPEAHISDWQPTGMDVFARRLRFIRE